MLEWKLANLATHISKNNAKVKDKSFLIANTQFQNKT